MSASVIDQRVFAQSGPTDLRFIAPERTVIIMPKEYPITVGETVHVDTFPNVPWRVEEIQGGFARLTKLRSFQKVELRDILVVRLTRVLVFA